MAFYDLAIVQLEQFLPGTGSHAPHGNHSGLRRRQLLTCDAQGSNWMRRILAAFPCGAWERDGRMRTRVIPECFTVSFLLQSPESD